MRWYDRVLVFIGVLLVIAGAALLLQTITGIEWDTWLEFVCMGHIAVEIIKKLEEEKEQSNGKEQ